MSVIDIHPHIVSPDTKRYPLAPLGGTQSTWSSERPTTYQMLLKEMDADVACAVANAFTARGARIFFGTNLLRADRAGEHKRVWFQHEGKEKSVEAVSALTILTPGFWILDSAF